MRTNNIVYDFSMMVKIELITVFLILFNFSSISQGIGINSTGSAPDESALLDLNSTSKGFLITRADTAIIVSPAFGLMTLSPIDSCLYMYSGLSWMSFGGVGDNCPCISTTPPSITFPCDGTVIPVVEVVSVTGEIWMDRNLGASQVANASTDSDAYGDLYQWGRCSDGHEKRTSSTVNSQSNSDTPGHSDFIIPNSSWRSPLNNNLWQGVSGINNPCPTGYRLPTETELNNERLSWVSNNATGAFSSPLKLTVARKRAYQDGDITTVDVGYYWSSTVNGTSARNLLIGGTASIFNSYRGDGLSVRCIKD